MKELTHIGTAQLVGKYHGETKSEPFAVRLRGTKTRWYDGRAGRGKWWPRSPDGGSVCQGGRNRSPSNTMLDLDSVRPMTVAELREPLEVEHARRLNAFEAAAAVMREMTDELFDASKTLEAFDKKHGWTGENP